MGNDLHLVKAVVGELADHGFDVAVFGGWAEELLGVAPPWQHRDIDLMLYLNDLQQLDRFVGLRGEVEAKRYSHKRAFVQAGTLVELFLAVREDGGLKTTFWDSLAYTWPGSRPVTRRNLPVVPVEVVNAYRRDYDKIQTARPQA